MGQWCSSLQYARVQAKFNCMCSGNKVFALHALGQPTSSPPTGQPNLATIAALLKYTKSRINPW